MNEDNSITRVAISKTMDYPLTVLIVFGVVSPPESGAESKVRESDVSVAVDEDIIRLDVAVDESHRMDGLNGQHELGDVELRQVVLKDALLDEQPHQITAWDVVHYKVQM